MSDRQSIPKIVNIRATEKGITSPEFMRWLFDRLRSGESVSVPISCGLAIVRRDWITQRFERVQ